MRLRSLRIEQFRCVQELDLDLDDVTILVGANGSGKSSVLHAVDWLFRGGPLEIADIYGRSEDRTVMVQAAFSDLSTTDRSALGRLAGGDALTVRRVWSEADGEEVTVTALVYPRSRLCAVSPRQPPSGRRTSNFSGTTPS